MWRTQKVIMCMRFDPFQTSLTFWKGFWWCLETHGYIYLHTSYKRRIFLFHLIQWTSGDSCDVCSFVAVANDHLKPLCGADCGISRVRDKTLFKFSGSLCKHDKRLSFGLTGYIGSCGVQHVMTYIVSVIFMGVTVPLPHDRFCDDD